MRPVEDVIEEVVGRIGRGHESGFECHVVLSAISVKEEWRGVSVPFYTKCWCNTQQGVIFTCTDSSFIPYL